MKSTCSAARGNGCAGRDETIGPTAWGRFLAGYSRCLKKINRGVLFISVFFLFAGTGVSLYAVMMRYIFNNAPSWGDELTRYVLIWAALLAIGPGVSEGVHLSVEIVSGRLHPKIRRVVQIISGTAFLILALTIMILGFELMLKVRGQTSTAMGISMTWPYGAIPLTGLLLTVNILYRILASTAPDKSEKTDTGARPGQDNETIHLAGQGGRN